MPRTTRAAARAEESAATIHEDGESYSDSPQPTSPKKVLTLRIARPALEELSQAADIQASDSTTKNGTKKGTKRGKKGKKQVVGEEPQQEDKDGSCGEGSNDDSEQDVILDTSASTDKPEAPETPAIRTTRRKAAKERLQIVVDEPKSDRVFEQKAALSPLKSPVKALIALLETPTQAEGRFEVHGSHRKGTECEHKAPLKPAEQPAPTALQLNDASEQASEAVQKLESLFQTGQDEDTSSNNSASTLADILSCTPAKKSASPVNKSCTGDALPALSEQSPGKKSAPQSQAQKRTSAVTKPGVKQTESKKFLAQRPSIAASRLSSMKMSPAEMSVAPSKAAAPRVKPSTPARGTAADQLKKRSAISALHTPPPAVKSTKPTTKSTFQLPGEAMAAKLKAQREERIKRQEEDAKKHAATKARPVVRGKPVEIKGTAASRARMSSVTGKKDESSEQSNSTLRSVHRPAAVAPRVSTLSTRPRPSPIKARTTASTVKARPSTFSTLKKTTATNNVEKANTGATAPSTAKEPSVQARQPRMIGKEVFNRGRHEQEALEKEAREKADAAKRARVDAAEKGRIASREWAEKMKKKPTTTGTIKKVDSKPNEMDASLEAQVEEPLGAMATVGTNV